MNPTGSVKDRVAKYLIEDIEAYAFFGIVARVAVKAPGVPG